MALDPVPDVLPFPALELFDDMLLLLRDIFPPDMFEFIEVLPLPIEELFDIDEFPIEELFDIEVFPPVEVFPLIDEFPLFIDVELFDIILEFVRLVFVLVSPVQAPNIAVETTKPLIAINFFIFLFSGLLRVFFVIKRQFVLTIDV